MAFAEHMGVNVICCIGPGAKGDQERLKTAQIIVGIPGRLLDVFLRGMLGKNEFFFRRFFFFRCKVVLYFYKIQARFVLLSHELATALSRLAQAYATRCSRRQAGCTGRG
jgi:hypothetical protein